MIILKGLPAAGKSQKAKEILSNGGAVRLNRDLLRKMLHCDKWSGRNEGLTKDAARLITKYFLSSGTNVIIDDTNLNPGTVQSWIDLAKETESKIEYVDLTDVSIKECLKRDSERENSVGRHVIIGMAMQYLDYLKGERVVICDLDGTLCDISHRLHFVKDVEKKDWKSFHEALSNDSLRKDVLTQVLKTLKEHNAKLIFVSGRPEDYRETTQKWLDSFFPFTSDYEVLFMRPKNDKREDTIIKSEIFERYLKNLNVVKIFDDRPSIVRMWREKGLDVEDVGSGIEF